MGLFKFHKSKPKSKPHSKSHSQNASSTPAPPPQQTYTTRKPNASSSNLSYTSTLRESQTTESRLDPPPYQTSYEAFLHQARLDADARDAAQRLREHAWRIAAQRRQDQGGWPNDPWRGGFGPETNVVRTDAWRGGFGPATNKVLTDPWRGGFGPPVSRKEGRQR